MSAEGIEEKRVSELKELDDVVVVLRRG